MVKGKTRGKRHRRDGVARRDRHACPLGVGRATTCLLTVPRCAALQKSWLKPLT